VWSGLSGDDPGLVEVLQVYVEQSQPRPRARVRVDGELDMRTADALRAHLVGLVEQGWTDLDVQLAGVRFCDVVGLNALVAARNAARSRGGSLVVHDPCPTLRLMVTTFHGRGGSGDVLLDLAVTQP
jgi:anti-anti-sigma factor